MLAVAGGWGVYVGTAVPRERGGIQRAWCLVDRDTCTVIAFLHAEKMKPAGAVWLYPQFVNQLKMPWNTWRWGALQRPELLAGKSSALWVISSYWVSLLNITIRKIGHHFDKEESGWWSASEKKQAELAKVIKTMKARQAVFTWPDIFQLSHKESYSHTCIHKRQQQRKNNHANWHWKLKRRQ